jgi:predicted ATPase
VRDRYPDLSEPTQAEATARQHLFEAITRLGQALAQRAPLVLFLDDWHWADAASLDLLHYAALRWSEEGTPILVLLTLRQETLMESPDLQHWLTRLKHVVAWVQVHVTKLSKAETEHLIRALVEPEEGDTRVPPPGVETQSLLTRFSNWLFAETAGHPLFLVEMLKTLVEDGLLRPAPASALWHVDGSRFDEHVVRSRGAALLGVREIGRGWLGYNLPLQLTSFIGREKEIAAINGLLDSARLVTLTGSGGTGKTRLSQEVGAQLLMEFPHGVWFIELAPLSDAAQIMPALARVFGLQEVSFNPLANRVLDYLRDKKLLLILDNCEHLIEACARLADDLLHQCAGLNILASSREALGIAGEMVYRIPPLTDSESPQLFVERAHAVHSNFKLTDANVAAIAKICRRLDNIPLALELAAARVKLLTPEQLASRLDDRFRLLIGGSRTALPRHQTLRAMLDWSYNLLSAEEKRLLQSASVFVGGWTLDALEAIADDPNTVELLEQLVNKSLVVTKEREHENRYFLLETIKQYAREKLLDAQQLSAARDRHFAYFDQLANKMWEIFRSDAVYAERFLPMVNRAEDEVENVRAALEWGLENHVEENVRLAANFCIVSMPLGILAEGLRVAKTAVERAKALPPLAGDADIHRQKLIAQALFAQGLTGMGVGNVPVVKQDLKEAITLSRVTGDKQILGYSLELYFTASTLIYEPDGLAAAQEGLKIFSQEINDQFGLVMAYINMARIAMSKGDEDEKHIYLGKLKEIMGGKAVYWLLILFHAMMGFDESIRGNYGSAKKSLRTAWRWPRVGTRFKRAWSV